MFSIESSHRGNSNEYKQHTIFNIKRKITLNCPKSAAVGYFQGTKNEFETAVVDEPSVFKPPKFYCMLCVLIMRTQNIPFSIEKRKSP